jgi:hypothetical protein
MKQIIVAAGISLLELASAAEAQDRVGFTIQAGLITGDDAAPLDSFSRPLVTASVQRVFKRHFVIEGEVSHWTLERVIERGPHQITGPQGVLGTVTGSQVVDSHRFWNIGINALVKSTGPVRIFGGAGTGLSSDRNVYTSQAFGCSPSLDPRTCQEFVNDTGRGPIFMVRALGGVEVPVSGHVELVGAVRAEKTAWEDRTDWLSATAGLRFSFD